jgi:hypothetical protein
MTMTDHDVPASETTAQVASGKNLTETMASHQGLDIAMSNWDVSSFTDWSNGGGYTGSVPSAQHSGTAA